MTTFTDDVAAYSHLVDATERSRTAALRSAQRIDSLVSDLRHAIEHGATDAALSLLASIDNANRAVLTATGTSHA